MKPRWREEATRDDRRGDACGAERDAGHETQGLADAGHDQDAATSRRLATAPWTFDFFAAVRWIESRHLHQPRLGASARLADDPLRLGQSPALSFAPATLEAAQAPDGGRPWRLVTRFFGLWGPQGAMPLHLTERVHERTRRQPADRAAAAFADVFHHRLLCLLYRAWSQGQPAASADRRGRAAADVRARVALPEAADVDVATMSAEADFEDDTLGDDPLERQARALQRRPRSVEALRDALQGQLGCAVRVRPAPPRWLAVPMSARCRLTALRSIAHPDTNLTHDRLDSHAAPPILGTRARVAGQGLRIDLGPLPPATWRRWSGPLSARLRAHVRALVAPHLAIDLRLLLPPGQAPPPRLHAHQAQESPRLGRDLWMGGADPLRPADARGWRLD